MAAAYSVHERSGVSRVICASRSLREITTDPRHQSRYSILQTRDLTDRAAMADHAPVVEQVDVAQERRVPGVASSSSNPSLG
jgi:hypothetical protein